MSQLNSNNLPFSPARKAVEVIRARMASATGLQSVLQKTVKLGIDAIQKDAMEGKLTPEMMTCARIVWKADAYSTAPNAAAAVATRVPMSVFFFYDTGINSPSVLPSEFVDLRERHLRWNIEYLKNLNVLPYNTVGLSRANHADDSGENYWWWPDDLVFNIEHDQPFNIYDQAITLPAWCSCSRLDFTILVKNHATFYDDPVPPSMSAFSWPLIAQNSVLASPDGSNGSASFRALTANDLPALSTEADSGARNNSIFVGSDHAGALCWKDGSAIVHLITTTP